VVDPLANHPVQVDKSPYGYAWNNPVLFTDPDGRCPNGCSDEEKTGNGYAVGARVENKYGVSEWTGEEWVVISSTPDGSGNNTSTEGGSGSGSSAGESSGNGFLGSSGWGDMGFSINWASASMGGLAVGQLVLEGKSFQFFGKSTQNLSEAYKERNFYHSNKKLYSQKFKGNQYLSSKSIANSLSTGKFILNFGRALTGLSVGIAGYEYLQSDGKPSDHARFIGTIIITSTAAIPFVGPFVSIGLGVSDSMGAFNNIYNSFDEN
jgi:hypothetical protein